MNWKTFIIFSGFCVGTVLCRSFTVDYQNNCFLKDGEPFRYMSGSIHYFRVPSDLWHDRIYKMKMAGLNAVQTYIEWSFHEPEPGVYNFKGDHDLGRFLKTAHDLDMLVILRAGPFIDAERDMGGFPYWLLREDPNMNLRTFDSTYIKFVDRWFNALFPIIEPYLYNNGGPVITIQIENEYGGGRCDAQYKSHLRDTVNRLLKSNVVLFTTDQWFDQALQCGGIDKVLRTMDFGAGANVTYNFGILRWVQATGPLVNSEFYPGYLDHWGYPHSHTDTAAVVKTLTEMLAMNASVNVYMFHGGTSFGFTAGSNILKTFQACPTSYDYDAPLSEAGDPTPKYYAMREAIGKFLPLPPGPIPQPAPKMKTAPIVMKKIMSLWDYISKSNNTVLSTYPLSFEDLKQPYGFVLYSTTVKFNPTDPALLTVKDVGDRAHVYVNKVLQGVLSRELNIESLPIRVRQGQEIQILVENQGRVCVGHLNDKKGIFQNVTLGSQTLVNWTMTPVPLDTESIQRVEQQQQLKYRMKYRGSTDFEPAIYSGEFSLPDAIPLDSFLRVDGWHKGVAFLNGFNLGRYWPIMGPQVTLYSPGIKFKKAPDTNRITLLELENSPCESSGKCTVQFDEVPVVNGTTPIY